MGLTLIGDLVDVDHRHNLLLNTGRHGNPIVQFTEEGSPPLRVFSTFQRHKAPRSKDRSSALGRGDNCHLLYALKGKNNLTTSIGAIRRLMLHFDDIITDMKDQTGPYDVIVPMPSGHLISQIYASRLARHYQCAVATNVFEKITKADAHLLLKQSSIDAGDKRSIAYRIGKEEGAFSLKDVPTPYRVHFPPLRLIGQSWTPGASRFLLADDLLATGTTLLSARQHLLNIVPDAQIDAACLFSRV